jgi:hypothetical protein
MPSRRPADDSAAKAGGDSGRGAIGIFKRQLSEGVYAAFTGGRHNQDQTVVAWQGARGTPRLPARHDERRGGTGAPADREGIGYHGGDARDHAWYRIGSNDATDANTSVQSQVGDTFPYLRNFTPGS